MLRQDVKKYTLDGKEIEAVAVSAELATATCTPQVIKDYIVALLANKRQWSANTKGRSEVKHTTKKPRKQKGTGGARQGTLVAPQFRGGGIVFGPKPKFDQHVRINKKERRAAIRALIAEKIQQGSLILLKTEALEAPKTKNVAEFLKALELQGKKVLFLGEGNTLVFTDENDAELESVFLPTDHHDNLIKSLRNIPGCSFKLVRNINGYDVIRNNNLVLTEQALVELERWLA